MADAQHSSRGGDQSGGMGGTSERGGHAGATGESPAVRNDWRRLHLWQIQPVRDLLLVAAIIGLVYIGYRAAVVTVPLLLAVTMAYLFEPFIRWLTAKRITGRRGAAIGIIAAAVLTVCVPLTVGVAFAVVEGVSFAGRLSTDVRAVLSSVENPTDEAMAAKVRGGAWRDIRDYLVERKHTLDDSSETLANAPEPVMGPPPPDDWVDPWRMPTSKESSARVVKSVMTWVEQNASNIASTVGKTAVGSGAVAVGAVLAQLMSFGVFVLTLFLTMFFFYFVSTGWGRLLAKAQQFIPDAGRYRWMRVIKRMDRAIAGFVRGRLTICAIVGVYMTIAFWFIGAPVPFLLGPVVGLLFLVPFAAAVAVPVVMLLLWLQSDTTGFRGEWWWILLAPIGVHIGGQFLDDYILTPRIQGDNTDLEMPTILFASMAGGALADVYGLLLAIPVAACLKILANEFLWPRIEAWVRGQVHDPLPIRRE